MPFGSGVVVLAQIDGSATHVAHDDAGNMISGPKPGDEDTRIHYVYDAWNRLTAVWLDDDDEGHTFDPESDTLIATYEYDGLGRRTATVLPLGQRATLLPWDMDFVFGAGTAVNNSILPVYNLGKLMNNPSTRRLYSSQAALSCMGGSS